jgi:hypothetical protein
LYVLDLGETFPHHKSLRSNCIIDVMELYHLVHCFRVGRATYVDASHVTDVDAGAYGVTVWLKALSSELKNCS